MQCKKADSAFGLMAMESSSLSCSLKIMTAKKFYDWQTVGGTDDVMRLVDCLERADIAWCAIGGVAVNHWAAEPMVTQDVDFVVATDSIDRTVEALTQAGFKAEKFDWSVNFEGEIQGQSATQYRGLLPGLPGVSRSVAADVHGILLRVASLEDTLKGKMEAWSDSKRRQSKRIKRFGRHRAPCRIASTVMGAVARINSNSRLNAPPH